MMRSNVHIADRRFDITMFPSFYGTYPTHEEMGATVGRIGDLIAPDHGPIIVTNKDTGVFFVPGALKDAPLVGKTLAYATEHGLPVVGKMRSRFHVTAGAVAKLDGDGLSEEQFAAIQAKLNLAGVAHLIYSTHSHGRPDKPGIRCRIILFFDRALEPADYQRAVLSLSRWLLGKSLDESEGRLSQQAGVWCAHPSRTERAFCIKQFDGACVSTDALLAAAPKQLPKNLDINAGPAPLDAERLRQALCWVDPNDYVQWIDCAIWLKAAYGDAAYSLWLDWSERAGQEAQAENDRRYAPDKVWAGITPRITCEQGAGALYAKGRDNAVAAARDAAARKEWGKQGRGYSALLYLHQFHHRLYETLVRGAA